jgi:hypothetical protein
MKMDVRFTKANTYHLNHKPEAVMRKKTSDLSLSPFEKIIRSNTQWLLRPTRAIFFCTFFPAICMANDFVSLKIDCDASIYVAGGYHYTYAEYFVEIFPDGLVKFNGQFKPTPETPDPLAKMPEIKEKDIKTVTRQANITPEQAKELVKYARKIDLYYRKTLIDKEVYVTHFYRPSWCWGKLSYNYKILEFPFGHKLDYIYGFLSQFMPISEWICPEDRKECGKDFEGKNKDIDKALDDDLLYVDKVILKN